MTQVRMDFGPQTEIQFPDLPPVEMAGKREVSMIEVCKALKKKRAQVTAILLQNKVVEHVGGRYMPKQDFINKGFFRVDYVQSTYVGKVPKVIVLVKGFHLIKGLFNGK